MPGGGARQLLGVAIAVGDGGGPRNDADGAAHQSADIEIRGGDGTGGGGVAAHDGGTLHIPHQPAGVEIVAGAGVGDAERDGGVAGPDGAVQPARQSAGLAKGAGNGDRAALHVAGFNHAAGLGIARQRPGVSVEAGGFHPGFNQPHIPDPGAVVQPVEQPGVAGGVDVQAGQGMALAVEFGGVLVHRRPGVVVAGRAGREAQRHGQFVADAAVGAAHAAGGAGGAAGKDGAVAGAHAGGVRVAVAVQIPADGVQLGDAVDVDQVVVVGVVILGGGD